jgi:hypothetical protein
VIQTPPDGIATGASVNVVGKTAVGVAQDKLKNKNAQG